MSSLSFDLTTQAHASRPSTSSLRSAPLATVFNFWEPLHYLSRGTGFQTWELSPKYAVRSWAYIATFLPAAEIAPYWINLGKVSSCRPLCLHHSPS